MEHSTILHNVSAEQIQGWIFGLQKQISDLKNNYQPIVPAEYLTRNEVRDMLKCNLATIHNWCKKGKLNPHGIGNRVYFKRSEVEAVIVPLNEKKGAKNE